MHLVLLFLGCTGDPLAPTEADTDTDADSDADTDTDSDTDADTDTDTDADTDVVENIPTVAGTPIATGCLAGLTPRTPVDPLPVPTLSQEGELGFTATVTCIGGSWVARFEESRFSDPATSATADAWDLAAGAWLGEWEATVVGPGTIAGTEIWEAVTPAGDPAPCSADDRILFSGVGFDNGTPSAPTATEDRTGVLDVPSAGVYTNSQGVQEATGQVTAVADEIWAWALYPEHDQAFGPFALTESGGGTWEIEFPLTAVNLVYEGMAYGFVACRDDQVVAVHGR